MYYNRWAIASRTPTICYALFLPMLNYKDLKGITRKLLSNSVMNKEEKYYASTTIIIGIYVFLVYDSADKSLAL
jgi:hypothetical protein